MRRLRSVVRRRHRSVRAVDDITFDVEPGEIVGFLGPNGAGKTTALKLLSGLLHPTSGEATVLDFTPWERRREFLSADHAHHGPAPAALLGPAGPGHLPGQQGRVWTCEDAAYRESLDLLVDLLELDEILTKPVRQLSLGERMKAELAAGLLHRPRVLFLDEPTIGLDVTMQQRIRDFVTRYNATTGATILLTSHYMADVKALAERVVVIDHGKLLYDGPLTGLIDRYAPHKTITLHLERPVDRADLTGYGEVVSADDVEVSVRTDKAQAASVTARMLAELPVADLSVEDPPLEYVIDQVFHRRAS